MPVQIDVLGPWSSYATAARGGPSHARECGEGRTRTGRAMGDVLADIHTRKQIRSSITVLR